MPSDDDTPEPSQSKRPSGILISPRTLLMAGAFAFGGTLGGGGLTFAASGIVPPELRQDLTKTMQATEALKVQMDEVRATLVRIEAAAGGDRLIHDTLSGQIKDHEERIRFLEKESR